MAVQVLSHTCACSEHDLCNTWFLSHHSRCGLPRAPCVIGCVLTCSTISTFALHVRYSYIPSSSSKMNKVTFSTDIHGQCFLCAPGEFSKIALVRSTFAQGTCALLNNATEIAVLATTVSYTIVEDYKRLLVGVYVQHNLNECHPSNVQSSVPSAV